MRACDLIVCTQQETHLFCLVVECVSICLVNSMNVTVKYIRCRNSTWDLHQHLVVFFSHKSFYLFVCVVLLGLSELFSHVFVPLLPARCIHSKHSITKSSHEHFSKTVALLDCLAEPHEPMHRVKFDCFFLRQRPLMGNAPCLLL